MKAFFSLDFTLMLMFWVGGLRGLRHFDDSGNWSRRLGAFFQSFIDCKFQPQTGFSRQSFEVFTHDWDSHFLLKLAKRNVIYIQTPLCFVSLSICLTAKLASNWKVFLRWQVPCEFTEFTSTSERARKKGAKLATNFSLWSLLTQFLFDLLWCRGVVL